jgi:hypothetical protein
LFYLFSSAVLAAMLTVDAHAEGGTRWWLSPGVGGGYGGIGGVGVSFALSVQTGPWVLSARTAAVGDPISSDGRGDVAALVGYGTQSDTWHLSLGVGAGKAGWDLTDSELALEAQCFSKTSGWFGIGVYGFSGFSSDDYFVGGSLALSFGQLK